MHPCEDAFHPRLDRRVFQPSDPIVPGRDRRSVARVGDIGSRSCVGRERFVRFSQRGQVEVKYDALCDRLSPMQRTCLRMTYDRMTGGDIARKLGISKSTVESHLAQARRILGLSRSVEAAIVLHEVEQRTGSCDVSTDFAPVVVEALAAPGTVVSSSSAPWWRSLLPVRSSGATSNDLTVRQRLFWIVVLAFAGAVGLGMLATAIHTASDIVVASRR